ncbi:MAG: TolC family protein [Bacteroidota bacterium]|nr:TolC family protein [Bacteroidota bacterium]
MKIFFLFLITLVIYTPAFSQEQPITLDRCLQQAELQFPLLKQKDLFGKINDYNQTNIRTNFLPQSNLNGQATWQSDVTQVPIKIPNLTIPTPYKDMYKLTLDVNQLIFDAGATKRQAELEKINLELNRQGVDVELYKLRDRVSQIYFGILLLKENEELLKVTRQDIETREKKIESSVSHGVMLASNLQVLQVEVLKIDQAIAELHYNQEALIESLVELTGISMTSSSVLQLPEPDINPGLTDIKRPELKLFELQKDKLTGMDKLTDTKNKPRLSGFGSVGYGRPGFNMLSNEFKTFATVGAKLSWNVWDWNQKNNERQSLGVQKSIIETQKDSFNQNLRIAIQNNRSEINKYQSLIETDNRIIQLRTEIKLSAASQLDNGVITSSDYLTEVNAELQARLDMKTHLVKLVQAKIDYLITMGQK